MNRLIEGVRILQVHLAVAAFVFPIMIVNTSCSTVQMKNWRELEGQIAREAERICPDIADGIASTSLLARVFADPDDVEFVSSRVFRAADAVCAELVTMERLDETTGDD